jgi:Flp pilus assembly protein TadD
LRGDLAGAIADYEAALRIQPDDETARQNLEFARGKLPWWQRLFGS